MPFRQMTGRPEVDALIASPLVQDMIARQIRYGQTRMLEVILALLMVAVGIALLHDGTTFGLASFRIIASLVSENVTGWTSLLTGLLRLWALWRNGRQNMPAIRLVGCAGGFFFWSAWAIGLAATSPPLVPLAPMAVVLAGGEFLSAMRCSADAYVFNTFGLRRRMAARNGPR